MIDLEKKRDNKTLSKVANYILSEKDGYFNSQCFGKLKNRMVTLDNSLNMRYVGRQESIAKAAFPIVKEAQRTRKAVLKAALRGDPLISLEAMGSTPAENAVIGTEVLSNNAKLTRYRDTVLNKNYAYVAGYGSAINYLDFRAGSKEVYRTMIRNDVHERVKVEQANDAVWTSFIDLRNYFQAPSISCTWDSPYKGHMQRWQIQDFAARIKNNEGSYIRENMVKVLKQAKTGRIEDTDFFSEESKTDEKQDLNSIDVTHFWGTLPITGNEDSNVMYYAEVAMGMVIRLEADLLDEGIDPYSHLFLEPRFDYWWGNTDAEFVLPHEQLTNLVMNQSADTLVSDMMRYFFYQEGTINMADINNRLQNQGFIPVDFKGNQMNLDQMVRQFSPQGTNVQNAEFVMRRVDQSKQDMSTRADINRSPAQGGPTNKTATAVNAIEGEGDLLEADLLDNFSIGLKDQARKKMVMLNQFLPDNFSLRDPSTGEEKTVFKEQMEGVFGYNFKSSLQKNKVAEAQRMINGLNTIVNYVQLGLPFTQTTKLIKPYRELIKNLDLGEVDEIAPEPQEQPQLPPGMGAPGMGLQAPQGAPQQPPSTSEIEALGALNA